jgi:hypothetical protein
VTGADGKQYIVKTGPGVGNGTVIGTVTATPVNNPAIMSQQQQQQQVTQHSENGGGGSIL